MSNYYPVIDAHCHVFPVGIEEKSKSAVSEFYDLPMYTSGTAHNLQKERSRVLSFSNSLTSICFGNFWIDSVRISFFFGSDFPMWDPAKELQRLLSFGLAEQTLKDILHDNFIRYIEMRA